MKIMILADAPNWSYHTISKGILKHGVWPDGVSADLYFLKSQMNEIKERHKRYDVVFAMGWQMVTEETRGFFTRSKKYSRALSFIDTRRIVTGIHSHRAWDGNLSTPDELVVPPAQLVDYLSRFNRVNAVSRRLFRLFQEAGMPNCVLTEPGVDTDLFRPIEPLHSEAQSPLRVGFAGSVSKKSHGELKGLDQFILPLQSVSGVELRIASGRQVALEEMPSFYNSMDVYLCASSTEGFSQSVLEASACGRPVISTRVGGCEDLIRSGENGFLVDRSLEAIREQVVFLRDHREDLVRMGAKNRERIATQFSWRLRASEWVRFIAGA